MSRKKLKLGITKTRQFRKKWKISIIKIKVFKKKLNKVIRKIENVKKKIEIRYNKNQGWLRKTFEKSSIYITKVKTV